MTDSEVKCSIHYNASSKKSYLWFTRTPPTTAILFLRKDGWVYSSRLKKWEYKQLGENSFKHAQKVQKRFYDLYKISALNDCHTPIDDYAQLDPVICSYVFQDNESKHIYIYFSEEPSSEMVDFLRKDNWIFDGIKDKWRYAENGTGGYKHALVTLNKLCQKFQIRKIKL